MRALLLSVFLLPGLVHAMDINLPPNQIRVWVGTQSVSPGPVNDYLTSQALKTFGNVGTYGIEGTHKFLSRLNFGVRGEGKYQKVKETAAVSADPANPYYSSIQQVSALLVLRLDLVKSQFLKIDAFGAAGTTSTSMDLRTSLGDSNYSHAMTSPVTKVGGSVGLGWSNIYFLVEAGYESNKVGSFTRTGATTSSIDTLDLSGSFVNVGLIFQGLPTFIHKK